MNKLPILCTLAAVAAFPQAQTPLTITQSAGSATGELRMQERRTNGTNYVGIKAPQAIAASLTYTLPGVDGTSGQCLTTDGAGQWGWLACANGLSIGDYIWTRTNGTDATATLTTPGANTITLTPCPTGLNSADAANYAYISGGTGTAEVVKQTGSGTGTGGDATCDVEYTTANAHSGAWTIQSATFRETVNVATNGQTLRVPPGAFAVRASTKVNKSVTIEGSSRIGVGGGSSITSNCTTCDVIDIDTELPVTLRNFGLVSSVTQSSGSGVRLRSTLGTHNCSSRIEDMTIYGFYDLIWAEEGCKPTIQHNELESPTRYGILLENTYLGDAGDQFVSENTITGNTSGTVGLYIRGGGGTKVLGNKFLGWDTSIEANITYMGGVSTSQLVVTGNEFDQGVSYGIKLGGTTDWVHTIISGNTFTPSGGSFTCYKFGGTMSYISVTGNTCTNAATVLDASSTSEPIWYWGNSAPGHTTLFTGTASVNWFAPSTFTQATLPAAANGSMVYCSNCTASGASGGTGAHAIRQNGAWVFIGGGQAHLQNGNAFGANAVYGTTDAYDLVFKRNGADQAYIENGVVTGLGAVRSLNTSIDTRIQSNLFASGGAVYTATNHDLVLGSDSAERFRIKNTGSIVPSITDTYDIGNLTTPLRVRGIYGKIIDTALVGGTGDYLQTRKIQLFDNTGSSTGASYWDLNVVMSGVGAGQNSYFYLRDNAGSNVFKSERIASGAAVSRTTWYTDLLPDTDGGRSIGTQLLNWDKVYANQLGDASYPVVVWGANSDFAGLTTTALAINTGAATVGYVWTATSTGGAGSWQAAAASQWTTTGSDIYYTTGNVAIGTTTPATESANARLTVVGALSQSASTLATSNSNAGFTVRANASSGYQLAIGATSVDGSPYLQGLVFNGGSSASSLILQGYGGNVGIGTTSPRTTLSVLQSGTANTTADTLGPAVFTGPTAGGYGAMLVVESNDAMAANIGGSIGFYGRNTTASAAGSYFSSIHGRKENGTSGDQAGYLAFKVRTTGNADNEVMRIASTGNVGINNATPTYKLDVNGTMQVTGAATFGAGGNFSGLITGAAGLTISGGNTTVEGIRFGAGSTHSIGQTGTRALRVFTDGITSGGSTYFENGSTVVFRTSSTLTLEIGTPVAGYVLTSDASGNATWQAAASAPFIDSTAIIKGSADATKLLKIEVDGFTTATTHTLTPQNASYTLAGTNITQTFVNPQTVAIASVQNQLTLSQTNSTGAYDPACLVLASTDTVTSTVYGAARLCAGYESAVFTNEKFSIQTATGSGTYQDAITIKNQAVTILGSIAATGSATFSFVNGVLDGTMVPLFSGNGSIGSATYKYGDFFGVRGNFNAATIGAASATVRLGQNLDVNYSGDYAGLAVNTWSATDGHGGVLDFNKSGSGTIGTHAAVVSGETLGFFVFRGSDGTAFQRSAEVNGEVDGAVSSGVVPGRLRIRTANSSGTMTERIRVDSAGLTTITGDLTITGTCTGCGSSSLPVADTTNIVKGSSDATKLLRFEVDGITTGTTRTLTPQNNSYTLAGTDIAQTFSSTQTFSGTLAVSGTIGDDLTPSSDGTFTNGTTFFRWGSIATYNADFDGVLTFSGGTSFTGSFLPTTNNLYAIGNTSFRLSNVATVNANISGTITAPSGGTGVSATKTVRDSAGTGTCTLIFSGGILTGGTC